MFDAGTALTTRFGYAGANVIVEVDSSGTLLRRYVYGPGIDAPIVMSDASGNREYYHRDGMNSVMAMTADNGTVTAEFTYGPYGETQDTTGNPYRYTGRRVDSGTGLYYYRNRYYSPDLGRFLSPDPIGYGDGMNMYAYVGGDPVNAMDPFGLYSYPGVTVYSYPGVTVIGKRQPGPGLNDWPDLFPDDVIDFTDGDDNGNGDSDDGTENNDEKTCQAAVPENKINQINLAKQGLELAFFMTLMSKGISGDDYGYEYGFSIVTSPFTQGEFNTKVDTNYLPNNVNVGQNVRFWHTVTAQAHTHPVTPGFSPDDLKTEYTNYLAGPNGQFLMYDPKTGETTDLSCQFGSIGGGTK